MGGAAAIIAAHNRKVNQNQSRVRHLSHKGKKDPSNETEDARSTVPPFIPPPALVPVIPPPASSKKDLFNLMCKQLGGLDMVQCEYGMKFGELTPDHPFGEYVFHGMHKMFLEEYRLLAKGARRLDGAEIKFAFFTTPLEFSRDNAQKKITDQDSRYGCKYPAMFFNKPGCWISWSRMVCLKQLIGNMMGWDIDPTRMSIRK